MGEKDTAKGKKKDKNPSDHNTPKGKHLFDICQGLI